MNIVVIIGVSVVWLTNQVNVGVTKRDAGYGSNAERGSADMSARGGGGGRRGGGSTVLTSRRAPHFDEMCNPDNVTVISA